MSTTIDEPAERVASLVDGAPASPATATGGKRRGGLQRWGVRCLSLVFALAAWHLLTANDVELWLRFRFFPGPWEVAQAFGQRLDQSWFYADLAQSVIRILTGFGLAAVLGTAVGIAVARSRWAADLLQPLLEVVRPIPAIALVPVAILLFPTNEQGIVFITCMAAFFPILVSTRHAVRALPVVWEDALRTMGATRRRVITTVVLPGIVPGVFGGLSVGMGVAWICVISAEMISGDFGVGYRTWQSYTIVDYPGVLVGMITIGVIGWLMSSCVELLGRRLTRWLSSEQRNPS